MTKQQIVALLKGINFSRPGRGIDEGYDVYDDGALRVEEQVDEIIAKIEADMDAESEAMAKELGLTPEQMEAIKKF